MKREYFTMIFIVLFTSIYLLCAAFFGYDTTSKFIVIWALISYFTGQYSTKYPKIK